jgi:hypothetical protein
VSYRFVVSFGTLQAAEAVAEAVRRGKRNWWQRRLASFGRDLFSMVVGALAIALLAWLAWQLALLIERSLNATARLGNGGFVPIVTFVIFLVFFIGLRIGSPRLLRGFLQRSYRDFYADNEFLLEGRKSHLWYEERFAAAIRRWSVFEQLVEFDQGMWLFLRRHKTFAGQRGILISKESLAGSCSWDELKAYLRQRMDERANEEAGP